MKLVWVAVACLAVTACGGEAPAAPAAGEAAPAAAAPAAAMGAPAGLPAYLAPMDGAKITQSSSHDGDATMMFSVDKPMADVAAHYREAIKAAGLTPDTDMGTSDGHSITYSQSPSFTVMLTNKGGTATDVSVMSSK